MTIEERLNRMRNADKEDEKASSGSIYDRLENMKSGGSRSSSPPGQNGVVSGSEITSALFGANASKRLLSEGMTPSRTDESFSDFLTTGMRASAREDSKGMGAIWRHPGNDQYRFGAAAQALETRADKLEEERQALLLPMASSQYATQSLSGMLDSISKSDELQEKINELRKEAKEYQAKSEQARYGTIVNEPDFQKYSAQGAAIQNPTADEVEGAPVLFGFKLGGKEPGNIVTYSRDNADSIIKAEANGSRVTGNSLYRFMTDDEVSTYNYLLAKEGEESASAYLGFLNDTLNQRAGGNYAENVGESVPLSLALATASGLEQSGTGLQQMFSREALPTSGVQYGSAEVRENLEDTGPKLPQWAGGSSLGQLAFDLTQTGANMLPSIAFGNVFGAGAGAASIGLSAGGNAYGDALRQGYSEEEAFNYGVLSGAVEAGLTYVLGGIGSLGGKMTGNAASKLASKIDNALLRIVTSTEGKSVLRTALERAGYGILKTGAQAGVKSAGEGFEEYLTEVLNPVIRNFALNEENDIDLLSEDAIYAGILGALSAGIMEAPSLSLETANAVNTDAYINRAYDDIQRNGIAGYKPSMLPTAGSVGQYGTSSSADWYARNTSQNENAFSASPRNRTARRETIQAFLDAGDSDYDAADKALIMDRILDGDTTLTDSEIEWMGLRNSGTNEAFESLTGREISGNTTQERIASVRDVIESRRNLGAEQQAQTSQNEAVTLETPVSPDTAVAPETSVSRPVLESRPVVEETATPKPLATGTEIPIAQRTWEDASKLELILDQMLSEGYTDADGRFVEPDENYIAMRDGKRVEGALSEEEWNSIMSQEPMGLPTASDVGPESSVGAAQYGFDPYTNFLNQRSEFFPEGANAARPVNVSTTDPQGMNIRKTAATATGAKAIPDEVVRDIQQMILSGKLSYNPISDRASMNRAVKTIQNKTFFGALEEFRNSIQKGVVSKDVATLGQQLLINAANAGDANTTAEILSLYAQMETVAGQAVQAASILRKLSPTAQLYAAQKVASNLEKTLSKQLKGENITINPDLITEFNEQTTQEGRDAVMKKIYKDLASQVPSTWKDKWNAWRYLAMLGNPRTHIRNIVGSVGFQPVRFTKDRIAALIESGVSAASGGKLQRTKSFAYNPKLYAAAWQDYDNVADVLSGSKYDDVQSIINDNRTIFKSKTLEALRKANTNALSVEDMWFKRVTYADALAGYLNANGVTVEEFLKMKSEDGSKKAIYQEAAFPAGTRVRAAGRNNFGEIVSFDEGTNKYLVHFVSPSGHEANVNLDASLVFPVNRSAQKVKVRNESGEVLPSFLQAARDYAGQEALKATYNDRNAVSDRVVQIARSLGTFGEAVLPFKRTPANILVRGVEYSPIGLAKGLTYDLYQVKQGNMTGAQAIDNIAAGMTGSGLMLLGALLAAAGVVTGGAGDDEKQAEWNELTGGQTYALNLPGGCSVTLDWMAPAALPFFMGVQAMESFGENGITADGITSAFTSISEPMLEMSMLQSLNDMLDNVSYAASNEKFQGLIWSSLVSYLTQAVPTMGGQIERSMEDTRMTTYTDKNLPIPTDAQYALGKASAKIPGWDYQQIPYIDAWGRQEQSDPQPLRTFNNFLNPAYTSQENVTPLDAEVQRLYDATGDGSVVPNRADKEITVDTGVKMLLTGEEYVKYATEKGQNSFELGSSIIQNPAYADLTDEEKADVLSEAYSYADAMAKADISEYEPSAWMQKVDESGVDPAAAILYRAAKRSMEDMGLSQSEVNDRIRSMLYYDNSISAEDKEAIDKAILSDGMYIPRDTDIDYSSKDSFLISQLSQAGQEKWNYAQSWGMSAEEYAKYYPICSAGGKKKDEVIADLIAAGMTRQQAYYFWDIVKSK